MIYLLWCVWPFFTLAWVVYDTGWHIRNWGNFTSWVWFLQTVFFGMVATQYLIARLSQTSLRLNMPNPPLWHTIYFMPLLFACEFSIALNVVYMMVVQVDMLDSNIKEFGPVITWIGNFIVHYLTFILLVYYIQDGSNLDLLRSRKLSIVDDIGSSYYTTLLANLFVLVYSYCAFFPPSTHYGIHDTSDAIATFLMVVLAILGLWVFFATLARTPLVEMRR